MFENLSLVIHDWYNRTNDRQKLQHFYIALMCIAVIVAGVAALFKNNPSSLLVTFAGVIAVSFLTNLLAWSVLHAFVLEKLHDQKRASVRTKTVRR